MTFVQETFTGAEFADINSRAGEIGATWTRLAGSSSTFLISNANRTGTPAGGGASNVTVYTASGTPPGAAYSVEGVARYVNAAPAGRRWTGMLLRIVNTTSVSTIDGYFAGRDDINGQWAFARIDDGVPTPLGTWTAAVSLGVDYTVRGEINGAGVWRLLVDGTERATGTDTTYTAAGVVGLLSQNHTTGAFGGFYDGIQWDSIVAAPLAGGGGGTLTASARRRRRGPFF